MNKNFASVRTQLKLDNYLELKSKIKNNRMLIHIDNNYNKIGIWNAHMR